MADVQLLQNHKEKQRRKRLVPYVDLTPMVDLAFLLITFFMLTVKLQEDHAMKLIMPDQDSTDAVCESCMLTVILDNRSVIWYYPGNEVLALGQTTYDETGIRQLIYDKQKDVKNKFSGTRDFICVIKMTKDAQYNNLVDILDEMAITNVKHYAIQDLSETEILTIEKQTENTI
ncbi:MAG: biopolymer transporter ExbD [Chitinophagales bacterium]|nr:biopolymer transporter ExbD [Chitinophagales bacterium]